MRPCGRGVIIFVLILLASSCARPPEVKPPPKPRPPLPPVPPGFSLKPFQVAMSEEMRHSYEQSNEILAAIFVGVRNDDQVGTLYYFDDFSAFDKESFSWSPAASVIVEVRPSSFKPEIIGRDEFKRLIPLDRVGICWDSFEGKRSIYLVEGQKNLIFLRAELDETTDNAYRYLIDAYPVTSECRSVDVFHLMICRLAEGTRN